MILSVIGSSFFSYFFALIFGFNQNTFFGCFLFFLFIFVYLILRKKSDIASYLKKFWQVLIVGVLVYIIYFAALYPAIFNLYNGYFVMGGPNWQDTAMHLSIIQSLTQGNFPPSAPYFSGAALSYYYFSDLHAAIVGAFTGKFFPQVLVILNPFLAAAFFFSVFALTYQITKKKIFSVIPGIMAVMYGNLGFVNLIMELLKGESNYVGLITTNAFNFDKYYLQMTPMADYFLQNRPMMVGLPAFVLVVLLLISTKKTSRGYLSKIFVAGIITGALIKFQLFGFVVCWIFFGIYFGLKLILKKIKFTKLFKYVFVYGVPSLVVFFLFSLERIGDRSLINIFLDSFSWGSWQRHGVLWLSLFLVENLGLGFLLYIIGFFIKRLWRKIEILSIYIMSFVIVLIPLVMKFTIYEFDMLKFFYYLIPLICVLLTVYFSEYKNKKIAIYIFVFIALISSLSSINMLMHSYFNKGEGYLRSDYEAGIWIIDNTPEKSVFVTMPTVRSAPSDIGGRLRIISYINWPHSHGFNVGVDNVFTRVADVEAVYATGDINQVKLKYGAGYVFYGKEEKGKYPESEKLLDSNKDLRLIYNQDGTKIYEIF